MAESLQAITEDQTYWEHWSALTEEPISWRSRLHWSTFDVTLHANHRRRAPSCQKHTYIHTHTRFLLHHWADSLPRDANKATVWTFFFCANLCSVWNILKVCELKPGISSLFKVIYLREVSALNPLKVWRDYNFSSKSTLLAGISSAVQCSAVQQWQCFSEDRSPAGSDNRPASGVKQKGPNETRANTGRHRANMQKRVTVGSCCKR